MRGRTRRLRLGRPASSRSSDAQRGATPRVAAFGAGRDGPADRRWDQYVRDFKSGRCAGVEGAADGNRRRRIVWRIHNIHQGSAAAEVWRRAASGGAGAGEIRNDARDKKSDSVAESGRLRSAQNLAEAYLLQRSIRWRQSDRSVGPTRGLQKDIESLANDFQKVAAMELQFYIAQSVAERCGCFQHGELGRAARSIPRYAIDGSGAGEFLPSITSKAEEGSGSRGRFWANWRVRKFRSGQDGIHFPVAAVARARTERDDLIAHSAGRATL